MPVLDGVLECQSNNNHQDGKFYHDDDDDDDDNGDDDNDDDDEHDDDDEMQERCEGCFPRQETNQRQSCILYDGLQTLPLTFDQWRAL